MARLTAFEYISRDLRSYMTHIGLNRHLLTVEDRIKPVAFNILTCCFFCSNVGRPFGAREYKLLGIGSQPAFVYSIQELLDKGYIAVVSQDKVLRGKGRKYCPTPKGERFLLDVARQAKKNHKVLRELLPEYFPDFYRLRKPEKRKNNKQDTENKDIAT